MRAIAQTVIMLTVVYTLRKVKFLISVNVLLTFMLIRIDENLKKKILHLLSYNTISYFPGVCEKIKENMSYIIVDLSFGFQNIKLI